MDARFRQGAMGWGRWEEGVSVPCGGTASAKAGRLGSWGAGGRKENGIISIRVERKAVKLGALAFEVKFAGTQGP